MPLVHTAAVAATACGVADEAAVACTWSAREASEDEPADDVVFVVEGVVEPTAAFVPARSYADLTAVALAAMVLLVVEVESVRLTCCVFITCVAVRMMLGIDGAGDAAGSA